MYKNVWISGNRGERRQGTSKKCQEEEQVSGSYQRSIHEKEDFL